MFTEYVILYILGIVSHRDVRILLNSCYKQLSYPYKHSNRNRTVYDLLENKI